MTKSIFHFLFSVFHLKQKFQKWNVKFHADFSLVKNAKCKIGVHVGQSRYTFSIFLAF